MIGTRFKGKSGQVYKVVRTTEKSISLYPEYSYQDGTSGRGCLVLPWEQFEQLKMEKLDGESTEKEEPSES